MNNSAILISGITGFVGSNLKEYLEKKEYKRIIGISRQENFKDKIISYKDCNMDVFNDSKVFIHLAGKAHDLKKVSSESDYYNVNTDLAISLFNQFLKSDCEIFIFLSTVKAVADKVEGTLDELVIPNPQTVYGKSKLKAEEYIKSQKLLKDKKVYILRPCMIHGPNNKGNLNLLYKIINKKVPFPLGRFKNSRSFLSIENLCFVITKLIEKKPNSGVYNVADDIAISTNELVRIIGDTINKKAMILNIAKPLISFFAKIGTVVSLPLNTEKLDKLTESYIVSNLKLKKAIKEELPLTSREGIKQTILSLSSKKQL